jgi:hypothetical protein
VAEHALRQPKRIRVTVDSGICGFHCLIEAWEEKKRQIRITISGSECKQIQRLSERIKEMNLRDLFAPLGKNIVFSSAQSVGCHPSCPVPIAILKAVEVAMGMALPKNVFIRFET